MQTGLRELLESTPHPSSIKDGDTTRYHVKPVPEMMTHYFGRDSNGYPCLLLRSADSTTKAPIRLSEIEVRFAIPCRILLSDGSERTETLAAIICTTSDAVTQDYFAHVCETILRIVGPTPSLQDVIEAVRRLVDLFQKLARPSSRSVIGLFGELYAIHRASSPQVAVEAWRSTIDDRFDFSIEDIRLEVKASSTRQRAHNFSLEQCTPPPETVGVLISLFVETSGGGLSVLELVERIERQLDDNVGLILKLQETVAEGLGATISTALAMRFDENLAKSSLQIYELDKIPAIR
ncbi:MAG TPA: PD-(D/E)XK motif protein, partial [Gammaproteobacteria bacterium]|nr:PD-(D/E)XK motif protein [Gammaproteobacteria bacterium]